MVNGRDRKKGRENIGRRRRKRRGREEKRLGELGGNGRRNGERREG